MIIESLVHVTSALHDHYLDLTLSSLEGKNAANDCSDDYPGYAGCGHDNCWIHCEVDSVLCRWLFSFESRDLAGLAQHLVHFAEVLFFFGYHLARVLFE